MNSSRLLIALFGLLLLTAQSWGQAPAQAQTATLRFLFLDESPGAYSIKIAGAYQDLGPTPYVISGPQQLPPGTRLELFKERPDPETQKLVRTRVLNQTAPTSLTHALVVVAPSAAAAADGSWSYNARFYDTNPEKIPSQSAFLLNLTPVALAVRLASTETVLEAGGSKVVSPDLDKRKRARTLIGVREADGWKMVYNSFISLRENTTTTGVLVYSPSGMRHTYTQDELDTMGPPQPGYFWLSYSESR